MSSGIFIHMDNASSHKVDKEIESLSLTRLKHQPHSPNLAPLDFFLFGYLKDSLNGSNFGDDDELLDTVEEILNSISEETLKKVNEDWIRRLRQWIEIGGELVE